MCRFINADEFASTGQGFIGYNMFAYCNNNTANCSDPSGNLACQNSVRMSNDGGGAYSLNGTPKPKDPNAKHNVYFTFTVDSDSDFTWFLIIMTEKTLYSAYSSVSACAAAVASVAMAPETGGASIIPAVKLFYNMVDGAIGFVSDIGTIVSGVSEYKKDGSATVEIFIPTSLLEAIEFTTFGPVNVRN